VRPLVVATVLLLGAGPVAVTGASDPAGGPRLSVAVVVAASASARDLPEALMGAGYQKIGRAWVYLIIAHEWGHAIQARLSRRMVSVAAELQADCLAGATLAGAQRDRTLVGGPQ